MSTATERAAQLIFLHGMWRFPRKVRFPKSTGAWAIPRRCGYPKSTRVWTIPRKVRFSKSTGAWTILRGMRFSHSQDCEASSMVLKTRRNVPLIVSGIGARKLVPSAIRGGKPSGYSFQGSLPRLGKLADFIACRLFDLNVHLRGVVSRKP